ncbi:MAG TPA: hypothetical protein ACFYED_06700 [Candidatus Tripitaka californicus]|uniref:hypothetical protein n=1 Tax=Candidatus Tripitaka californicus TaxID=3367616 RepID=UPI004029C204|nr:hypothetical protein [Planctomycetota bacterium]
MEKIELKEFVRKVIAEIEDGLRYEKVCLGSSIKFEVSVSETKKSNGELKISVASGEAGIGKESVAKVSFDVYPYDPHTRQERMSIHPEKIRLL